MHYLLKTEPDAYSFARLLHDRRTVWDGISNPVALKHLAEMKRGDELIIYHTGSERRAVGHARVVSVEPGSGKNDVRVTIEAVNELAHPVSLAEIKADRLFAGSPLVRQGRLSVVPLTAAQFERLSTAKI